MSLTHIETIELGSSQSSITFSSIPQDYDDLVVLVSARSTRSHPINDEILTQFNGDTSSNYTIIGLRGNGSSASSVTGSVSSALTRADMPASGTTANTYGNTSYYISNYKSSVAKSISIDTVMENNNSDSTQHILAGLWDNSAAITSIFMKPEVADFASDSVFSLYGITAGGDGTVTTS